MERPATPDGLLAKSKLPPKGALAPVVVSPGFANAAGTLGADAVADGADGAAVADGADGAAVADGAATDGSLAAGCGRPAAARASAPYLLRNLLTLPSISAYTSATVRGLPLS